jgi:hypothetical protein
MPEPNCPVIVGVLPAAVVVYVVTVAGDPLTVDGASLTVSSHTTGPAIVGEWC